MTTEEALQSRTHSQAPADSGRPIFLCYRQIDGKRYARWVFSALQESLAQSGGVQEIYFDQTAPAITDWHALHGPALERARAIVVICTPGLYSDQGSEDWVHRELDWWLNNRSAAPIIVDATGEGARWIPEKLKRRWPNSQRVNLDPDLWENSPPEELALVKHQVATQILGGISNSEISVVQQDLAKSQKLNRLLFGSTLGLSVLAIALLVAIYYAVDSTNRAHKQQQISLANKLAAQAELTIAFDPNQTQTGTLLAIEAFRRLDALGQPASLEVDQTLRRGVDLLPRHLERLAAGESVHQVSFSSDGHLIAASSFRHVRVWETKSYQQVMDCTFEGLSHILAFSRDSRYLVAVSPSALRKNVTVYAWEISSGSEVTQQAFKKDAVITFSPNLTAIALSEGDDKVGVLKLPDMRKVATVVSRGGRVIKIAFDPHGPYMGVLSDKGTVDVWEWENEMLLSRRLYPQGIRDFAFLVNGRVATLSTEGVVSLWEVKNAHEIATTAPGVGTRLIDSPLGRMIAVVNDRGDLAILEEPGLQLHGRIQREGEIGEPIRATFSPNGEKIVVIGGTYASGKETARVWDLTRATEVARLIHGLEGEVSDAKFSLDGEYLATSGWDGVRIWAIGAHRRPGYLVHGARVWVLAFTRDGQYLATGSDDGTGRVWETETGREVLKLTHGLGVIRVAFNPNGEYVATGSYDRVVQIAKINNPSDVVKLEHDDQVYGLAWLPDNQHVVTAAGRFARIWEVGRDRPIHTMTHKERLEGHCLLVSPLGDYILTATGEDVFVWNARTGEKVKRLAHDGGAEIFAFSDDGKYFASQDYNAMRVWRTGTWDEHLHVPMGIGDVHAVAFSPDGKLIATAHLGGEIKVWDSRTGRQITTMRHDQMVQDVVFSHDGTLLASVSWDRTARVWETIELCINNAID